MNNQKAIEWIKAISATQSNSLNKNSLADRKEALHMAIQALEKQIGRKPQINTDKYSDLIQNYYCPACGRYFGQRGIHNEILFNKERYCQGENCGQAIDWSES